MFGYVITNPEALPKERQQRFRAFYCGLCATLRRRHGLASSAALSYDMTFLAMLLNAVYEPGERFGREGGKQLVEIAGKPVLTWSAEAFDAVADVGLNPTRTGVLDILSAMGAHLSSSCVVPAAFAI